jgi:CHRD domain
MKRIPLAVAAGSLGIVLVVAGAAVARTTATTIQLRAAMSAAEEVPAPAGDVSNARGVFSATATRTDGGGASIAWTLTFTGLTGPAAAAHIHTGPRGQAGPVVVPLCGPCESGASGTATVDATLLSAIQSGGTYVNVHTGTNRAGEIRAQLGTVANVRSVLNARQEVPKPKGSLGRAAGVFTATAAKSDTGTVLTWRLTFSRLTGRAVAAHIHIGRRGRAGAVAVPLCGPCRSGARGSANLSGAALAALEAGRTYVNVHTRLNPAGEIRGQLPAIPLTITP